MAEHTSVMRAFVVLSQTRKNGGYLLRLVFLIFSIYTCFLLRFSFGPRGLFSVINV